MVNMPILNLNHDIPPMILWTFACVIALTWALIWTRQHFKYGTRYPPSPPGYALFTNGRKDCPVPPLWCACLEWGKTYGNILFLQAFFTRPIVALNSLEDATELLGKRSHNYSSRPKIPMYELMGYTFTTGVKFYGAELRYHRRILEREFRHDAALLYRPVQTEKMIDALYELLTTPEDFIAHIKTYAAAIILSAMYGYDVSPKEDKFVILSESSDRAFSEGPSSKWTINTFPFLRHVPSWVPGAGFKRYASSVRSVLREQLIAPYQFVVESLCHTEKDYDILQQVTASGYNGLYVFKSGVGTVRFITNEWTASSITNFLIAMVTFPEVQTRAQLEIDNVTGGTRLPDYSDLPLLPYIEAMFREVLRWKPIVPLGLPHICKEEDIYNEYYIPKETLVHPNIWAMTRDPTKYIDAENFNSDRFLNDAGKLNDDRVEYAFGFGRRICPGQHLASASVWLAMATILSMFTIGKMKDAFGDDIPLEVKFTENGILSYPLPFKCTIKPRSDKARQLILEAYKMARN
ncbi:cytochrome P450 [Pholiota conissans]|uniref:Cytochrome P450 n=1 Tax=Pholiota conissans TaxID=109636 RepID=A0A9P5YN51_9AGAR|nr:cytochrome P450 [Pholiota conissans]